MFDHIGIFVSDFEKSAPLYEKCLEPLGIHVLQRQPEWNAMIFAGETGFPFLWLGGIGEETDYHGTPLQRAHRRPVHLAFRASSKEAVDLFHQRGMAQGAQCNGAPEDCGNGYYAAYLLDFDGNNLEAGMRPGSWPPLTKPLTPAYKQPPARDRDKRHCGL